MSQPTKPLLSLKPLIRANKNLVYKGKKYHIDFDLFIKNSNYFYKQRFNMQGDDIELPQDEIEITDESIEVFISSCHNEFFQLTDSNVFPLFQLSLKFEVPCLQELTQEYIQKNDNKLIFESILFKLKQKHFLNDTSKEEKIIASNFFDFINDDRLVLLPVKILYRIVNDDAFIHTINEQNESQFIEFLFKCLNHHKREASVLFLNLDLENQKIDLLKRLIDGYSDIFDFNMINPKYLLKTTSQLLSEVNKLKHNYSVKIDELNQIIKNKKEQFDSEKQNFLVQFNELKNQQNERIRLLEEKLIQQDQIISQFKKDIKSSVDSQISNQNSRNDQLFDSINQLKMKIESIEKEQNKKNDSLMKELEKKQNDNSITFNYNGDSFNGIFNYLRKNSNIADEVDVTRSSDGGGCKPLDLFNYGTNKSGFCTHDERNPWNCFELKRHRIIPTFYSIKDNGNYVNSNHLRSWVIQGSNDLKNWEPIDEQTDCSYLNGPYAYHTFQIKKQNQKEFRCIRIYSTGPNWCSNDKNNYVYISAFEIFGKLI